MNGGGHFCHEILNSKWRQQTFTQSISGSLRRFGVMATEAKSHWPRGKRATSLNARASPPPSGQQTRLFYFHSLPRDRQNIPSPHPPLLCLLLNLEDRSPISLAPGIGEKPLANQSPGRMVHDWWNAICAGTERGREPLFFHHNHPRRPSGLLHWWWANNAW